MKCTFLSTQNVTTALLLAAGTGSRLYPLTKEAPKCLTIVNGRTILERMVSGLNSRGFKRLVIVTGHLENKIKDFLGNKFKNIQIEYIFSPLYKETNNIYSLWMARQAINEPFLLLESDLVYDDSLLDNMLTPNKMAVSKMQPWLNGTCVTINKLSDVKAFIPGSNKDLKETKYKTVNIYSISKDSWSLIVKQLNKQISINNVNSYYETVFADMVADGSLSFKAASFDNKPWYEIDTIEDLGHAEKLFALEGLKIPKRTIPLNSDLFNKNILSEIISSQVKTGV